MSTVSVYGGVSTLGLCFCSIQLWERDGQVGTHWAQRLSVELWAPVTARTVPRTLHNGWHPWRGRGEKKEKKKLACALAPKRLRLNFDEEHKKKKLVEYLEHILWSDKTGIDFFRSDRVGICTGTVTWAWSGPHWMPRLSSKSLRWEGDSVVWLYVSEEDFGENIITNGPRNAHAKIPPDYAQMPIDIPKYYLMVQEGS